jgi:hypothetical protein
LPFYIHKGYNKNGKCQFNSFEEKFWLNWRFINMYLVNSRSFLQEKISFSASEHMDKKGGSGGESVGLTEDTFKFVYLWCKKH